ncbi:MAG: cytochrome c5 family protein [Betaproteobacteria bacterium]|nr:cytochrome c5 family protein [Betaproteobacteria bacterium]
MEQHEHTSFIKTWQQLVVVVLLSFVVPVIVIIMIAKLVTGGLEINQTSNPALDSKLVAERIKPVASVAVVDASKPREQLAGEAVYKATCMVCHAAGVANAPKLGDKATWGPRIKEGFAAALANTIKGTSRGMPAKGGNTDLSDLEVARAVVYMGNQAGAGWKEPAAEAKKQ